MEIVKDYILATLNRDGFETRLHDNRIYVDDVTSPIWVDDYQTAIPDDTADYLRLKAPKDAQTVRFLDFCEKHNKLKK